MDHKPNDYPTGPDPIDRMLRNQILETSRRDREYSLTRTINRLAKLDKAEERKALAKAKRERKRQKRMEKGL